jgi:hypothetical protein
MSLPMRYIVFMMLLCIANPAMAEPVPVDPPKLLSFEKIRLPSGTPAARGRVEMILHINKKGDVTKVELKAGMGEPYDASVQRAALNFKYRPAMRASKAIGVRLVLKVPVNSTTIHGARRGLLRGPPRHERRLVERSPGYHYAGKIVEKGTRSPLAGVMVLMRDRRFKREKQTTTNRDGVFSFDGLTPGRQRLEVVTPGHGSTKRTVRPVPKPAGEDVVLGETVYLSPKAFAANRTVVVDTERKAAAAEIKLVEEELTQTPGTLGDPTRVVQTLPGVSRSPFGLGYYVVRGASFENTGFFIDGHPALLLYHFLGGPGVIHPELVGSISFYPGGYPAKYGRFATGAIAIETKDPPMDRWHLDFEVDIVKASLLFSTPFDDEKGQVTASVRQSYYEALLPLFQPDINIGFTDYQLRLKYQFTPKIQARFLVLGSEDRFSSTSGEEGEEETSSAGLVLGFHRVLGAVDLDLSKEWKLKNSMIFEYDYTSNFRTAEENDDIDISLTGWFTQLRSWVEFKPSDRFFLEMGLDGIYSEFSSKLQIPILPPLGDPRPPTFNPITTTLDVAGPYASLSPYALADWELVKGLRLLPGIRLNLEGYDGVFHLSVDPRLSIRWQFLDDWTLKTMGGVAHQPPSPATTYEPVGDPNIPPVRGIQGSLGFEWQPSKGWEVSVEGFYNDLSNIVRPSGEFDTSEGGLQTSFWSPDVLGRAYGLELLVRKKFGGRVHGWLSYTLSRSERKYPPNDWVRFGSDQTHILNLAGTVRLPNEYSIGARFTLTSGNPYYPIVGSRYDADSDRYVPIYAAQEEDLPIFHRLDLRFDKRWRFDTWMLEGFLDIQNVYNANNPESMAYSFDFSEQGPGASFPFLPTFGMRAVF